MKLDRRELLARILYGSAAANMSAAAQTTPARLPGAYRGRVVAVAHSASIDSGKVNRQAVRDMLHRGMVELTGAPSWQEAWRVFFHKGDVVGLKLNPVGRPYVISSPETVQEIIACLNECGIRSQDIVAYDRYKREFEEAGFPAWLPAGVRWTSATDAYHDLQLDMAGYDSAQYVELPLVLPDADPMNPHHRRSYLSKFITKDVNKLVNLCLLKHHQSAGITMALKNLSHGLVNNVSRSHVSASNNSCGTFIPAIVDHAIIRRKVAVNICDAVLAAYHGGPGGKVRSYTWEHKTMYFSADPVAMDRVGWTVLDAKRIEMGRKPLALAYEDDDSRFVRMQPEHIEIAGLLGLGEGDSAKIDLRQIRLA
jgi:uncharacterized protein (DUF362 family)